MPPKGRARERRPRPVRGRGPADSARRDASAEALLSGLPPRVRALVDAARERILSVVPHATERVRPGWRLIGYDAPAYFAFISLEHEEVRIGFEWGVLLDDPSGLLGGSGTQVRYAAVRSSSELERPALATLLVAAAALVPPRRRRAPRR